MSPKHFRAIILEDCCHWVLLNVLITTLLFTVAVQKYNHLSVVSDFGSLRILHCVHSPNVDQHHQASEGEITYSRVFALPVKPQICPAPPSEIHWCKLGHHMNGHFESVGEWTYGPLPKRGGSKSEYPENTFI